jgi:amidase
VLGALVGVDARDEATSPSAGKFHYDYTQFLDARGLDGARIGVARHGMTGFSGATDAVFEHAIQAIRDAGATVDDHRRLPRPDH